MKPLRLLAIALPLAVACSKEPLGPPARITALPRALTAREQQLIQADNRFAIKLLKEADTQTRDTLPNLFVSPLSAAMALAMTYNGAAGTTATAMDTTLELAGMSLPDVNQGNQSLIALLRGLDRQVQFQIANSIWYRKGLAVEQPFIDANRTYFDAQVEGLDFTAATAAQTINAWVDQQTHGLIKQIVEDPIPPGVLMYLMNAIYFKGEWTRQFDKQRTAPQPFHLQDGSTVSVPTMTYGAEVPIRRASTPIGTVIDLPYGGAAFSMTIVLPRDSLGVDGVLANTTIDDWNAWIAALDTSVTGLYIPKFKLENNLTFRTTLAALGMGIAFTEFADFSGMHQGGGLMLTDVKHRTYVDVNEEGTTAAAVTAVVVGPTSVPPTLRVDRPFVFALRENLSGTILFMGVIRHP